MTERPEQHPEDFPPSEKLLAECLEDHQRRRARGEGVTAEDYRERLGDLYPELLHLLAAETAIEEAMTPPVASELPATFGDFRLVREIGRGAVGVVYEAEQVGLGRKVALKVLRTGFDTDPRARERFAREARVCAQIRHENVVTLYASGEVEGRPYYAMSLVDGEPLSALIRRGRAPRGRDLFLGLAGIADGLRAVHEAGTVHRDVKPSNIVVEPNGRMVLTDFGLARAALSVTLTATGEALGTPLYMSPEQMLGKRGGEIDQRTDVYGLGATLYEAVAGRPPFKSEDLGELMGMILHQRPRRLREVAPDSSAATERVAMKALEKRPNERYDTALAMRSDLLALAEGRPVDGRPVSAIRHALREKRAIWVPVAAVLLLAIGAYAWYAQRSAKVRLDAFPRASTVWRDGVLVGKLPYQEERAPGEVVYEIQHDGFVPLEWRLSLAPGGDVDREKNLVPRTPEAQALLDEELRRAGGVGLSTLERNRGSGTEPELIAPRGTVRTGDLTAIRILVMPGYALEKATLFFARDGKTFHEEPLKVADPGVDVPVPTAVLNALRPGDEVTWGIRGRSGYRPVEYKEKFAVVAEPSGLSEALARIDRWTVGEAEKDVHLRSELRAHAYLKHDLALAALRELQTHVRADGSLPTLGLTAAHLEAMSRIWLYDTSLWGDARLMLERFPPGDVDRFYEAHAAAVPR